MNIIVKRYRSSKFCCRPDTTWERENRDLYSPECVNEWHWVPVIFARISKAGKCVSERFASRYYDAVSYGALLYIGDMMPDIAASSCADHTSFLPSPMYDPVVFENKENRCRWMIDGKDTGTYTETSDRLRVIEEAICRASMTTSLRTGDFIAVELAPTRRLLGREEGERRFSAGFCENTLFDFRIIF